MEAAAAGSGGGLEMRQVSTADWPGQEAGAGNCRTTSGSSIFLFLECERYWNDPDPPAGRG
jgi:hypothetical protein